MKVAAAFAAWVPLLFAVRPHEDNRLLTDDGLDDGGQEHAHRHHSSKQGRDVQEALRSEESLPGAVAKDGLLPKKLPNCSDSDGALALSGLYEVTSEMRFPGDCKISTTGAAEVRLGAPISFEGEVHLLGTVAFTANTPFPGPCVTMGRCTAHRRSNTSFAGCENSLVLEGDRRQLHKGQAGALNVVGDLHLRGSMSFTSCSTMNYGGALYVGGNFTQEDGDLRALKVYAERCGGAVYIQDTWSMSGGHVAVQNATAASDAGVLQSRKMSMSGGSFSVQNAVANEAGAFYIIENLSMSGGSISVQNASAKIDGGAFFIEGCLSISGGNLSVQNVAAGSDGGALYVHGGCTDISGGSLQVLNASAKKNGGAIYIEPGVLSMSGGNISLQNVVAGKHAGALYAHPHADLSGGSLRVLNATANQSGGCLYVGDINKSAASHVSLRSCSADEGGGIRASMGSVHMLGRTLLDNCTALKTGAAISAAGHVKVEAARVSGRDDVPTIYASNGHIEVAQLDCAKAPGCRVAAASQELGSLTCAQGQGRFAEASSRGCATCEVKHTRLASKAEACTPCPNMTKTVCEPDELGLPPGTMVLLDSSLDNLSDWYFCPSKEVCPGGRIQASPGPESEPKFLEEMCAAGYDGPGCVKCKPSFARPDGNTMRCVECANTTQQAALYVARQMMTDLALFASATATVTGAKKERPISSTWLNMLMAFAAVAGIVMSAVMQTGGFARLQESAQSGLEAVQVPVVLFQGGASSPVMSGECLLQFFRLPKELYLVHLMTSILPALLCVLLTAAKGFWLALVVTTNVFLPRFVAAFGKYLVSFRVRPADMPGGELHMDFLPDALGAPPMAIAIIASAIACCFVVGVGSWTYVVMARKQPLQPHVAYLMCAYKTEYAFWEVERLGRKMLIALLTTMIPVTVSPALQMAAVSIVLSCSQLLYLIYEPYQVSFWNKAEQRLLLAALVMIGLTSYLIANDLHWAQSDVSQQILIFLICGMASGTCMVMMLFVARAFYVERCKASEEETLKRQTGRGPA